MCLQNTPDKLGGARKSRGLLEWLAELFCFRLLCLHKNMSRVFCFLPFRAGINPRSHPATSSQFHSQKDRVTAKEISLKDCGYVACDPAQGFLLLNAGFLISFLGISSRRGCFGDGDGGSSEEPWHVGVIPRLTCCPSAKDR